MTEMCVRGRGVARGEQKQQQDAALPAGAVNERGRECRRGKERREGEEQGWVSCWFSCLLCAFLSCK